MNSSSFFEMNPVCLQFFYLADVEFGSEHAKEIFKEDEGNLFIMRPGGIMAILPVGGDNLFRIMAQEADLKESDNPNIDKAFIDRRVQERCGINIDTKRIAWSGTFEATYGVSDAYYWHGGLRCGGCCSCSFSHWRSWYELWIARCCQSDVENSMGRTYY